MILERILDSLGDGSVLSVCIGLHWTAVVAEKGGVQQCGLSATLYRGHTHTAHPHVPEAGDLERFTARELAEFVLHDSPVLASVGMAAVNALLPQDASDWRDDNAEELILQHGKGKRVALVGHFPFIPHLRTLVGDLQVLELEPQEGDLPADMAPQILPGAQVVAITGMSVVNGSLEGLLEYCSPQAFVILMGPSTPLVPLLFDYGVQVISGAVVTSVEPVLKTIMQGGNFKQVHKAGVKLVNLIK